MRLADFLDHHREEILKEAAAFAKTLPTLIDATEATLRDHFSQCLDAIASDLRQSQSRTQSIAKGKGHAPATGRTSAAEQHGVARANSGLSTTELVSEYRAMRASVLRLWRDLHAPDEHVVNDLMRFNEAIDQALAESVLRYEEQVEHWRHIFLGVVGHDLRTPLNAIALTAEVIRRQAPEGLQAHAEVLSKGTRRISSMLDSLLDYNNSQIGAPMPIQAQHASLCEACEEEVALLSAALPHARIALHCEGRAEGRFDISRLREALSNLVANAVQHGCGPDVQVHVREQGGQLLITVRNAGTLAEEQLPSLFEPLKRGVGYRTGHRTNLGLGLFICKQIAQAHAGDIEVRSEKGHVEFTLGVPANGPR